MLNSEGSVQDAVIARLRVGWGKFKDLSNVLCKNGNMLNSEGSVQDAVIARLRVGWGKFKDLSNVLCKKGVSLRMKGIDSILSIREKCNVLWS